MKKILLIVSFLSTLFASELHAQPAITLADSIRSEFIRSWDAYRTYAWGHDLLQPVTRGYADWYKESLHISPIDAYSTMQVMGLTRQAKEVEQFVIDSVSFDKDIFVKTFEVNIRILGGLLAMYEFTKNPVILAKTRDFGDRLLKAFNSPTGIPYYLVNLKTGETKGEKVNTAEAASYTFELGILSYYTRDPRYYQAGKKATLAVYNRRSALGLVGFEINNQTGEWMNKEAYIGAGVDSYLEYLYKSWLLFKDPDLRKIWDQSITAINLYIPEESDSSLWYGHVDMNTGAKVTPSVTLYDAFFASILAMDGHMKKAEKFQATWNDLWNKYGLEPMVYNYKTGEPTYPVYDLNPEIIESAWYLYQLTGNPKYRQMGIKYYSDIVKYCKTDIAFSSIADVRTMKQNNELPTFFFAETMKYLYLLAGGNPGVNIQKYVFNTEAHPFLKSSFDPALIRTRLGLNRTVERKAK